MTSTSPSANTTRRNLINDVRFSQTPKLQIYHGDKPAIPFVSRVDHAQEANGWSDKQAASNVYLLLDGIAGQWIQMMSHEDIFKADDEKVLTSWTRLRKALLKRFQSNTKIMDKRQLLRGLYQKEMEDPSIFFERCYNSLESTKQEPKADRQRDGWMKAFQDELMQIYLSGLQEPLRCRVEEQADLNTPEKLVEAACNIFNATKPARTSAFVSATTAQPKDSILEDTPTSKQQDLIDSIISMIGPRNGYNRNFRGRGRSNFRGGQSRGGQFRNRWNNRNQSQQRNQRPEVIRNPNVVCFECQARGHPRRLCPRRIGGGARRGVAAIEHKPDPVSTPPTYTGVVPQTYTPPVLPLMYDQSMYATPSPLPQPQPMIPAYTTPAICSIGALDGSDSNQPPDSNGVEAIKIQKRPFFKVSTEEGDFNFLVDTGACTSCISSRVYQALRQSQTPRRPNPKQRK